RLVSGVSGVSGMSGVSATIMLLGGRRLAVKTAPNWPAATKPAVAGFSQAGSGTCCAGARLLLGSPRRRTLWRSAARPFRRGFNRQPSLTDRLGRINYATIRASLLPIHCWLHYRHGQRQEEVVECILFVRVGDGE